MNDNGGEIPYFYTGDPDSLDVKDLVKQASGETLPAKDRPASDYPRPVDHNKSTTSPGGVATGVDLSDSPFVHPVSAEQGKLSELQEAIREINRMGLMLEKCRNEAVNKGAGGSV